jgi:3-ketosteroid 9alpha-monooxygenase subunit B
VTAYHLRVADVVTETDDARSFVLDVPRDLAEHFRYRPGQFLTVRVPTDAGPVARCYSLSSAPPSDQLTITVKKMPDGLGSVWLCDQVKVGTELEVLPPAGRFTPQTFDADFLLVAAGSGITPVLSILRTALAHGTGRSTLLYANRDERSVIFAAELRRLIAAHPGRLSVVHWLESVSGLPTSAALAALCRGRADGEVFLCGPTPFMVAAEEALRELGVARIHVEKFQSLAEDPFEDSSVVEDIVEAADEGAFALSVELDGVEHEMPWPAGRRMLDVLVEHGLAAPSSCREGRCGACTCRLEDGAVDMVNNEVLDAQDLAEGYVLACQSLPRTGPVRITYS